MYPNSKTWYGIENGVKTLKRQPIRKLQVCVCDVRAGRVQREPASIKRAPRNLFHDPNTSYVLFVASSRAALIENDYKSCLFRDMLTGRIIDHDVFFFPTVPSFTNAYYKIYHQH